MAKKKSSRKSTQVSIQQIVQLGIFWQALMAVLGSLYFSTYGDPVANVINQSFIHSQGGFAPCFLCWWARILMYPILFISSVGIVKNDKRFTDYVIPLAIPGVLLEIYHYTLQKVDLGIETSCTAHNPCDAMRVDYFGFITIPFLCLIAFSVILGLSLYNQHLNKSTD